MKKFFYQKLALNNIKNNSKTYIPYILTCIGTVLMFYNMASLNGNKAVGDGSLSILMGLGTYVTAFFSVIFIFYTNSFLVKRRMKEFGLYNVLGMEKKHIARIMFWENTFIGVFSIIIGMLLGIAFSKLVTLALYKLLNFDPNFQFEINAFAIEATVILFVFIFILTLLSSLLRVKKSKPIELLHSSNEGEKQPRSNWFLAVIGVITLGLGYTISITVKNPFSAFMLFFVAVILVIIGTYCLFTAGSVVILKLLRKNKKYYYKTNHFVSVSSMIYRMKKNAVGLSNIAIMSTAVIVMISTTVSMYVGMNDLIDHRFPTDVEVTASYQNDTRIDREKTKQNIKNILNEDNISYKNFTGYEYLGITVARNDENYSISENVGGLNQSNTSYLILMTIDNYNSLTGKNYSVDKGEALILSERNPESVNIFGKNYKVKENIKDKINGKFSVYIMDTVYAIVNSDDIIDNAYIEQSKAYDNYKSNINYSVTFDFNKMSNDEIISYCNKSFDKKIKNLNLEFDIKQESIQNFYYLYGSLFFLGIFLGTLVLCATVLIIYYKQVVEGFDDKERFKIMQNIGMSKNEVSKTINSQVLTVFLLPLIVAVIHFMVAFPILKKLLAMLNLTNVKLFALCSVVTIIIFAIVYALIYFATSKVYKNIVNNK